MKNCLSASGMPSTPSAFSATYARSSSHQREASASGTTLRIMRAPRARIVERDGSDAESRLEMLEKETEGMIYAMYGR